MGNREKILAVLQQEGPLCDGCLQQKTQIKHHAAVNQITTALAKEGLLNRYRGLCSGDKKIKLINCFIDDSVTVPRRIDTVTVTSISPITGTAMQEEIKQKWYWEGNVQNKIVEFLKQHGYKILNDANTASKEPGVDIVAISPEMKRLLVSVKGFPSEEQSNKSTQARHWFAEAIFDLVLYRQDFPEVSLAIGIPYGFPAYLNLSKKVTWFQQSLPFRYFWVTQDGNVTEE
jgi:hypothetical protein